jgi:hypothetical protein
VSNCALSDPQPFLESESRAVIAVKSPETRRKMSVLYELFVAQTFISLIQPRVWLSKNGSAQEFDGACILSRFLKNDKFLRRKNPSFIGSLRIPAQSRKNRQSIDQALALPQPINS